MKLEDMANPCIHCCYQRFGKQYTSDCDDKCAFAYAVKENKMLNEQIDKLEKYIDENADGSDYMRGMEKAFEMIER